MINEELLKVDVVVGDFGYNFVFMVYKEDKVTPFDLTDYEPHLVTSLFDAVMEKSDDPTDGTCSYTLEANKFTSVKKIYEARIRLLKADTAARTVFRFYIVTI